MVRIDAAHSVVALWLLGLAGGCMPPPRDIVAAPNTEAPVVQPSKSEDAIVVVQREVDEEPVHSEHGFVLAADERRAYVAARIAKKSRPETLERERYIALVGTGAKQRKVPLEKLIENEVTREFLFAAPKEMLPPPVPISATIKVAEGDELTYSAVYVDNQYRTKYEQRRLVVKVSKMISDEAIEFTAPQNIKPKTDEVGLLVDGRGRIVALAGIGYSGNWGAPTERLKDRLEMQLDALRMRVSQVGDETVVDFALQIIDPFASGHTPQVFMTHPPEADRSKPEYDRLTGKFEIVSGRWRKPAEGIVLDLNRVETLDPVFEIPAASDWCRPSCWTATYRFRAADKVPPVQYQCVALDAAGNIHRALGGSSHVKFDLATPQPLLFKHPVFQYDAGKPIAGRP